MYTGLKRSCSQSPWKLGNILWDPVSTPWNNRHGRWGSEGWTRLPLLRIHGHTCQRERTFITQHNKTYEKWSRFNTVCRSTKSINVSKNIIIRWVYFIVYMKNMSTVPNVWNTVTFLTVTDHKHRNTWRMSQKGLFLKVWPNRIFIYTPDGSTNETFLVSKPLLSVPLEDTLFFRTSEIPTLNKKKS